MEHRGVLLMMGCSSGFLRPRGQYDPDGMVLNFCQTGARAVVANLWDVTDGDIDKFTISMLNVCASVCVCVCECVCTCACECACVSVRVLFSMCACLSTCGTFLTAPLASGLCFPGHLQQR